MKVGLIDVDGHGDFPNLPLMKLSAWHKAKGDSVEWYSPMFSGHLDKVYVSKVFTFSPDYEYYIDADEVVKAGTGYRDYYKTFRKRKQDTHSELIGLRSAAVGTKEVFINSNYLSKYAVAKSIDEFQYIVTSFVL